MSPSRRLLIAIDGPAASGKGTIAQLLADAYGLPHLDTGLLYRAVGAAALDQSGRLNSARALAAARALRAQGLDFAPAGERGLRGPGAGEAASRVAALPQVRDALLKLQRDFAARPGGAVLDGRDIATVVAPEALVKIFVTAAPEVRARRRWSQLTGAGEPVAYEAVLVDIRRRDTRDASRTAAPLALAPGAALLDTTDMDISTAVEAARRIVEQARARP